MKRVPARPASCSPEIVRTFSLLAVLLRHLGPVLIVAVRVLRAGRYSGSYPERSVGEASPIRSFRPSIGLHSADRRATLVPTPAAAQAYHRRGPTSAVPRALRHASHVTSIVAFVSVKASLGSTTLSHFVRTI